MVLEKTLENFLDCKGVKPVKPKEINPKYSLERHVEDEAPIPWLPDVKSQLIGKEWCWERLKAKGEEGGRGWDS